MKLLESSLEFVCDRQLTMDDCLILEENNLMVIHLHERVFWSRFPFSEPTDYCCGSYHSF